MVAEAVRVEQGVPLPGRPAPYTTRRAKYPFARMKIGDSFETPKPGVSSAVKKYRDRMAELGEVVAFLVRKQKNGRYRCWRVDPNDPEFAAELRPRKPRKPRNGRKAAKLPSRAAMAAQAD